jgi:hypothetical protein
VSPLIPQLVFGTFMGAVVDLLLQKRLEETKITDIDY